MVLSTASIALLTFWADQTKLDSANCMTGHCERSVLKEPHRIGTTCGVGCLNMYQEQVSFWGDYVVHLCAGQIMVDYHKISSGIGVHSIVLEETGIEQVAYSSHALQDGITPGHGMQCGKVQTRQKTSRKRRRRSLRKGLEMKSSKPQSRALVLGLLTENVNLKHISNWCHRTCKRP